MAAAATDLVKGKLDACPVAVVRGLAAFVTDDDGPGADAQALERLKRPYERGAASVDGSGLGLSMVESIARQSGAVFELRSPVAQGRGLAATLRFTRRSRAAWLRAPAARDRAP